MSRPTKHKTTLAAIENFESAMKLLKKVAENNGFAGIASIMDKYIAHFEKIVEVADEKIKDKVPVEK